MVLSLSLISSKWMHSNLPVTQVFKNTQWSSVFALPQLFTHLFIWPFLFYFTLFLIYYSSLLKPETLCYFMTPCFIDHTLLPVCLFEDPNHYGRLSHIKSLFAFLDYGLILFSKFGRGGHHEITLFSSVCVCGAIFILGYEKSFCSAGCTWFCKMALYSSAITQPFRTIIGPNESHKMADRGITELTLRLVADTVGQIVVLAGFLHRRTCVRLPNRAW